MNNFKVEYLMGRTHPFSTMMGAYGRGHSNVVYSLGRETADFPDMDSAQKFFDKLENTWETEEIYMKDRKTPHVVEIKLMQRMENKWVVVKKSEYEDWYQANKERKWAEKEKNKKREEPAGIEDNIMENKKQINLKENELRKIVENKVRGMLKEMFEEQGQDQLHRYVMGWSQADSAWMVVYAHDLEEAEAMFENGEYQIENEG